MKRNLIITADDYGLCRSANDGIEACIESGTVRATCVMPNMPACEAAASLPSRFPYCSVGIHWTLTQGAPVLSPSEVKTLVDVSGEFHSIESFRSRWIWGRIDKEEIRAELNAQHSRFTDIVGAPEFWNTHENVHVLPGLFQHCVSIGKELSIPAMRCHRRLTVPFSTTVFRYEATHPSYWVKGKILDVWSRQAENAQVRMPDGRIYAPGYGTPSVAFLHEILDRLSWSKIRRAIEVVVHPATRLEESLFGALTNSRLEEYNVLREPSFSERLARCGVVISNFKVVLTDS